MWHKQRSCCKRVDVFASLRFYFLTQVQHKVQQLGRIYGGMPSSIFLLVFFLKRTSFFIKIVFCFCVAQKVIQVLSRSKQQQKYFKVHKKKTIQLMKMLSSTAVHFRNSLKSSTIVTVKPQKHQTEYIFHQLFPGGWNFTFPSPPTKTI